MIGYKESAQCCDPFALDADRSNDKFITTRFRDLRPVFGVVDSVGQAENGLVGVMYHGDPYNGDIVVANSSSWVYAGSGVTNGSRFTGLLGYETDAIFNNGYSPPQLRKLADSPDPWGGSQMVTYVAPSGSVVFTTGSMQWSWGLDNYGHNLASAAVQQATRNVLARFAQPPLVVPSGLLGWTQSLSPNVSANKVYRAMSAGGPYVLLATLGPSTSFNDTTAGKKSTYFYAVTAVSNGLESGYSNTVSATSR